MTNFLLLTIALAGGQIAADTKETAHDTSRWQPAIARFEAQDARQAPPQGAILFVGSSSVRMWDLPKYFPGLTVINRGFGGSEIADAVHFIDRLVIKHRPRTVVLYSGDNDIAAGKSAERVHNDFRAFVEKIRAALPETKIVVISIKPCVARWKHADTIQQANALIAATCANDKRLDYVDVWTPMLDGKPGPPSRDLFIADGLHLSHKGYLLWAEHLRPHLGE